MMKLYLEGLKDQAGEVDSKNAKAAREEILEDDSLVGIQPRNGLLARNTTLPNWKATLLKSLDRASVISEGPKL
jgi:hypothetical protein